MRRSAFIVAGILALVSFEGAWAQEPAARSAGQPLRGGMALFRGFGAAALQSGGDSFSGGAAWTPEFGITESLDLRFFIGGAPYLDGSGSLFAAADAKALAAWSLTNEWSVEAGGGIAFWLDNGDLLPMATAGGVHHLATPILGFINRLFVDYSMIFTPATTHQIQIGAGFSL